MILELPMFTLIHVVVSVLGVIAGLVVAGGLMAGSRMNGWTALFLAATLYTSVSGFGFPFAQVTPAHIVGVVSLVVLALCIVARYVRNLQGSWRAVYVTTAVAALYLNVFVLVVQLFAKTPPLAQLAPTQKEAPFVLTQLLILATLGWLGRSALLGFRAAKSPPG